MYYIPGGGGGYCHRIIYRYLSVYATKKRNKRDDCITYLVRLALMKRNKHVKSVIYFVLKDLMKRNKRD